jgi:hypothetical protein
LKLSVRAVGNHLKRWGFTQQKPIKRAYQQCHEAVQHMQSSKPTRSTCERTSRPPPGAMRIETCSIRAGST